MKKRYIFCAAGLVEGRAVLFTTAQTVEQHKVALQLRDWIDGLRAHGVEIDELEWSITKLRQVEKSHWISLKTWRSEV